MSDNNIGILPASDKDSGYLLAALSTDICYWQIIRRACGTSIPYLDAARVRQIPIPWAERGARDEIAEKVLFAMALRSQAVKNERAALQVVEGWIQQQRAA